MFRSSVKILSQELKIGSPNISKSNSLSRRPHKDVISCPGAGNIVLALAITDTNTRLKKMGLVFISQKYPETFLASRLGFWAQLQVEQYEKRAHTMNHRSDFLIIHRQRSSDFSQKYRE